MQANEPHTDPGLAIPDALLVCLVAGAVVGALVGAVQIRAGKWHPVRAGSPLAWFGYPLSAGLLIGLMAALLRVPDRDASRWVWLVLSVVVASMAALLGSGLIAYFCKPPRHASAERRHRRLRLAAEAPADRKSRLEERVRGLLRGSTASEHEPPSVPPPTYSRPPGPPKIIPRRDAAADRAKTGEKKQAEGDRPPREPAKPEQAGAKQGFAPTAPSSATGGAPKTQGRLEKPIK